MTAREWIKATADTQAAMVAGVKPSRAAEWARCYAAAVADGTAEPVVSRPVWCIGCRAYHVAGAHMAAGRKVA